MPIPLPLPIHARCVALINLGTMMNLFSIQMFMHVMEVNHRLMVNELMIHDLQDFKRLCSAILDSPLINQSLRAEIEELSDILELFITVAYSPIRPCGMWSIAG